MTTPFWCLLIGLIIPYVLTGVSAYFKKAQLGSVDNNLPRRQSAELTGTGERAVYAQLNAWEALTVFGIAVFVAHLSNADPVTSANLAMAWVAFRIVHAITYVTDLAPVRSLAFAGGLVCSVWLFFA
ncbi:MAG: MAPEG family protein [Proteobacteria bacterium]|nr:MAPEG family protein [Pseudomonadota bacterium]